jgi:CheY-like chemotaxis protein
MLHAACRIGAARPFRISISAMAHILQHRSGDRDRRRLPRGGRRAKDQQGYAPLVLLVGSEPDVIGQSEAVLAKLRFAVATSGTVEEALRVMRGIRPDIVVADANDAARIRLETPDHVPVVVLDDTMRADREALVEGIRETLRANPRRE